jgi:hypothetical protein
MSMIVFVIILLRWRIGSPHQIEYTFSPIPVRLARDASCRSSSYVASPHSSEYALSLILDENSESSLL